MADVILTSVDGTWTNSPTYDAAELRRADLALVASEGISFGLVPSVDASDLVTVTRGAGIISGEDAATGTGIYRAGTAASVSANLEARDATNSRKDLVVLRQYDPDVVGTHTAYATRVEILTGTPSATPSAPALPSMAIELAKITVPASGGGSASVDTSGRVWAQAIGSGGTWEEYSPAWSAGGTAPSVGNGSLVGSWARVGDTIHYRIRLLAGSTTTFGTGAYLFSLPTTPAVAMSFEPMGHAVIQDVSTSTRLPRSAYFPSGLGNVVALHDGSGAVVTNTVPFTFASGDIITIRGTYEAA